MHAFDIAPRKFKAKADALVMHIGSHAP